jgi:hypothetical protein
LFRRLPGPERKAEIRAGRSHVLLRLIAASLPLARPGAAGRPGDPAAGFRASADRPGPGPGHRPRGRRVVRPGRSSPGPAVEPAGSGRCLGARAPGRGGQPTGRWQAAPRLGRQAGPGHEGADHRMGEEEGAALEDRRMDPAAGRGGLPVRPRPAARDDPLTEPRPPTPRAEAFARSAWAWCQRKHLNQWNEGGTYRSLRVE